MLESRAFPPQRIARDTALAFLIFAGLSIAFTWPVAQHPASLVPSDLGDPVLNTWILWWNAFHLPFTDSWWNAAIFHPAAGTLAFSEHLLGLSPIATPIIWVSGTPLLAYNVCFVLTFVLSATSAYVLGYELTGRRDAAYLAGLAFGFAPYRVAQISHLQVLASFWMPLALLALHRFARTNRRSHLVWFVVAFVMQALSNGYYLAFFTLLLGLWLIWFARPSTWRSAVAVAGSWAIAMVMLAPILLKYRGVHADYGLTRNLEHMRFYSADLAAWLGTAPWLWLWGGMKVYGSIEGALFTGFTGMALALLGAILVLGRDRTVPGWRPDFVLYAGAALVLYLLAAGPSPTLFGAEVGVSGPYVWLASLPGFASLRVPARLGMLVALCLALAAAIAFSRLTRSWPRRPQLAAAAMLSAAMLAESWPREIPMWEPPQRWDLSDRDGTGPLLVLPILNEMNEAASMYRSIDHRRPLVNGYSGHIPPWYLQLREALNDSDDSVLEELARAGVSQVALIHRNDREGAWREFVSRRARLRRESASGFSLFDLAPPGPLPEPGSPLSIATAEANARGDVAYTLIDGRAETWWSTLAPQTGSEEIVLDLGELRRAAGIEMDLGDGLLEFPRFLEVDLSVNGTNWSNAWKGPTAGRAVGAVMRDNEVGRIRLGFPEQDARFVRLRQLVRHRQSWTVAELRVLGSNR